MHTGTLITCLEVAVSDQLSAHWVCATLINRRIGFPIPVVPLYWLRQCSDTNIVTSSRSTDSARLGVCIVSARTLAKSGLLVVSSGHRLVSVWHDARRLGPA